MSDLTELLTAEEMDQWQAFFALEPWGYKTENRRAGMVTATIANFIGRLSGPDALTPSDIFPEETTSTEWQDPTEQQCAAFMQSLRAISNG